MGKVRTRRKSIRRTRRQTRKQNRRQSKKKTRRHSKKKTRRQTRKKSRRQTRKKSRRQNNYVLDGGEVLQETTYDKIKKVRKNWDYKDKPASKGEPKDPPPELDPKTGMHPRYGKNANRYKKLDPISANSMPKTGDPEIDAEVEKAKKKPK